jgi:iron(III) transport system permease protein
VPTGARVFLILLACLALLPIAALAWIALTPAPGVWPHLLEFVLPRSAFNTVVLLVGVGFGTAALGVGSAWFVSLTRFPGRQFLQWALVLPLAMPVYIAAYGWVEFLDYSGPVQNALRDVTGWTSFRDYWFPDIRSLTGAVIIFTLVLYPYVYIPARLVFMVQGATALDAARGLGAGPARLFTKVALPLSRPAIAAGVALALMETLNDIGAVEVLGVRTLTYAVFETWLNRDSLSGAVQLALLVLLVVGGLIWLERAARNNRDFARSSREREPARLDLSVTGKAFAFSFCALPVLAGLGIPLATFATFALRRLEAFTEPALLSAALNSLTVALLCALLAVTIAYLVLQTARLHRSKRLALAGRLASLGYAIPGTVLALGLLVPLAGFDNWLDGTLRETFNWRTGLLLSGTIVILVYAHTLRFLSVAYGTIETAFLRVPPTIDMASRGLGRTGRQTALFVHVPILRAGLAVAAMLVFVDSVKELSATLLLRPFGFQTLPTLVYERASQAAIEDAAPAALAIVLVGLIPVAVLNAVPSGLTRGKMRQLAPRPA